MRNRMILSALLSFAAGLVCHAWLVPRAEAQAGGGGRLTELKRVDLGTYCPGREVAISIEEIAPQHQGKHFHNAHSFAWMIEGSQMRYVDGQPAQKFGPGDVTEERPQEVSESDILTPTKIVLFRILEKGKPLTVRAQ